MDTAWFRIGATRAPAIGVVVPTCNRWPLMRSTVASLLAQDCAQEVAIAIVDDGSTDRTAERLAAWLQQRFEGGAGRRSVAILRQSRAGVSVARNRGIAALRRLGCSSITHQDDDDLALPWKLRLLRRRLDRDPTLGLVHSRIRDMTTGGLLLPPRSGYTHAFNRQLPGGSLWERARRGDLGPGALERDNYIHNAGVMVTAAALDRLEGDELYPSDTDYGEDWAFHRKLDRAGVRIGFCDRVVALYRNDPSGLFMKGFEPRSIEEIAAQVVSLAAEPALTLLTFLADRLPRGVSSLPPRIAARVAGLVGLAAERLSAAQADRRLADAYAAACQLRALIPTAPHRRVADRLRRELVAALTRETIERRAAGDSRNAREHAIAAFALAPTIRRGRALARLARGTANTDRRTRP